MNSKFLVLVLSLTILLTVFSQSGTSLNASYTYSIPNQSGKHLIEKESEPIINIITFNETTTGYSVLVAFMTHIESFILNKADQQITLLANDSFGLNENSAYIWAVRQLSSGNFIASISNGSIFSFTFTGSVLWINTFSNKAISDLRPLNSQTAVAISDAGQIIWFNSTSGSLIKILTYNNTFMTVLKSFNNYFVTGNSNGTIYVFNETRELFSANISQGYQVIALAINDQYLAAFGFHNSLVIYNTVTGSELPTDNFSNIDYDSLFLIDNVLYFSNTNGLFTSLDLATGATIWSDTGLYIDYILKGEFNGDSITDLITFSSTGNVLTMDISNGTVSRTESISNSQITCVNSLNINNDNITDLLIGTRSGEIFLYIGKDLTPPQIINNSLNHNVTDTSINITFRTNEPSSTKNTYLDPKNVEVSSSYPNLTNIHVVFINNLQPSTNYTFSIIITDKAGNTNNRTILSVITTPAPPPYLMYGAVGFIVLIGGVSGTYYFRKYRLQRKAFQEAERYYEAGDYILAIKSYIKANNKEKIIDIVTFLVSNPQLSSFVDEIKQMEELSAYMVDIQEIIQSQKI